MSAPIDRRSLMEHTDFVRAVARRLLDEHRAEDVVQETMLAALEQGNRLRRDVRGWLATVARNFARMTLRGEARRSERERRQRPYAPVDTPDAVATRLEAQRHLVEAVRALPEAYRIVIALRFFEGMSPGEIARHQGVPVKTIHTRLRRAFERLRDRLDRDYGGDHRSWAIAIVSLASARRARWLSSAALVGAGVWSSLKIPVALLLVAAAALVARESLGSDVVQRAQRGDVTAGRSPTTVETRAAAEAPTESGAEDAQEGPRAQPSGVRLEGTLVYAVAAAVEPASVSAYRVSHLDLATGEPVRGESGPDRGFRLDVAELVADPDVKFVELHVDQGRHQIEKVRIAVIRARTRVRFERVTIGLSAAAVVHGRIIYPAGRPIAGAAVALFREEEGPVPPVVETTKSDSNGLFRLRAPGGGRHIVLAAAAGHRPAHSRVVLVLGDVTRSDPLQVTDGAAIHGMVTVNSGAPRPATVRVEAIAEGRPGTGLSFKNLGWTSGGAKRSRASAWADADGAFSIEGLEPGRYTVRVAHIDDAHPDLPGHGPDVIAVAPANRVQLDLAVSFVDVFLRPPAGGAVRATGATATERVIDAEGRVRFALVPGRAYRLQATQSGFEPARGVVTAPEPGRSERVVFDLEREAGRATLRVRLRGESPAIAGFGLSRPDALRPSVQRSVRGVDGVFELTDLAPGPWRVSVLPGAAWYHPLSHYLEVEKWIDLPRGVVTTVEVEARTGGRFRLLPRTPRGEPARCRCQVLDAAGRAADVLFYIPASGGWRQSSSWIGPAATEVGPALPAGRYRLRVFGEGILERILDAELEEGKTSVLAVEVRRR